MSNPKYEQLIKDHPLALSRVTCGIYYPDGWNTLISNLCDVVERQIGKLPSEHKQQVYVIQIKSKFGSLRYYMNQSTPHINGAIELAESLSFTTCETCSNQASTKQVGNWTATLCDSCHQKELDKKTIEVIHE